MTRIMRLTKNFHNVDRIKLSRLGSYSKLSVNQLIIVTGAVVVFKAKFHARFQKQSQFEIFFFSVLFSPFLFS